MLRLEPSSGIAPSRGTDGAEPSRHPSAGLSLKLDRAVERRHPVWPSSRDFVFFGLLGAYPVQELGSAADNTRLGLLGACESPIGALFRVFGACIFLLERHI